MTNPLPVFHFLVEWGGARVGFTEVSGLEEEVDIIEYREGSSPSPSPQLIPGLRRAGGVVLRRGLLPRDNELYDWFNQAGGGTVERRDVTVSLLNAEHEPTAVWRLANAWPAAISISDLDAAANAVAIESVEIVCESVRRQMP